MEREVIETERGYEMSLGEICMGVPVVVVFNYDVDCDKYPTMEDMDNGTAPEHLDLIYTADLYVGNMKTNSCKAKSPEKLSLGLIVGNLLQEMDEFKESVSDMALVFEPTIDGIKNKPHLSLVKPENNN
jgi:hypothetical protein